MTPKPVSVRLDADLLRRADRLCGPLTERLAADPLARRVARGGAVSRHAVLLLAIERGLDDLEREWGSHE